MTDNFFGISSGLRSLDWLWLLSWIGGSVSISFVALSSNTQIRICLSLAHLSLRTNSWIGKCFVLISLIENFFDIDTLARWWENATTKRLILKVLPFTFYKDWWSVLVLLWLFHFAVFHIIFSYKQEALQSIVPFVRLSSATSWARFSCLLFDTFLVNNFVYVFLIEAWVYILKTSFLLTQVLNILKSSFLCALWVRTRRHHSNCYHRSLFLSLFIHHINQFQQDDSLFSFCCNALEFKLSQTYLEIWMLVLFIHLGIDVLVINAFHNAFRTERSCRTWWDLWFSNSNSWILEARECFCPFKLAFCVFFTVSKCLNQVSLRILC